MAVFNLDPNAQKDLLKLPETGMGFQIVRAALHGEEKTLLVLNAELALDLAGVEGSGSELGAAGIGRWIYESLNNEVAFTVTPSPSRFRLLSSRVSAAATASVSSTGTAAAPPPSALVKTVKLAVPRTFHRFSPFSPDKRVDPATGAFLPGTYACPESELPFVPTGFAVVGRFALPSSKPASNHYVIEAEIHTTVRFGTVAPAFGQAGGGVEALFPNGAVNVASPTIAPTLIPDE